MEGECAKEKGQITQNKERGERYKNIDWNTIKMREEREMNSHRKRCGK